MATSTLSKYTSPTYKMTPIVTPQTFVPTPVSTTPTTSKILSSAALAINSSNMSPAQQQQAFKSLATSGGTYTTPITPTSIAPQTPIPLSETPIPTNYGSIMSYSCNRWTYSITCNYSTTNNN